MIVVTITILKIIIMYFIFGNTKIFITNFDQVTIIFKSPFSCMISF